MIKNILFFLFVIVFSIFALDHFKVLPSDDLLSFNKISYLQKRRINNFSAKPKEESVLDKFPFTGKYAKQK